MVAAQLPERIDKYIIQRELPGGGMGTVYLASDPGLRRRVVIKLVREAISDPELLERFGQEARATAALRHDNIVTVYGSGLHEGRPYMAMEFVEGASLHDLIKGRETIALHLKLSYLEQICSGLHCAHRAGIVHRDIKPANVMIDGSGVVRILDFGIARVEGSGLTSDGTMMGTYNYMSPEQMLGQPVDSRSDIFSVGALAYELLAYQQAFPGGPHNGLLQRLPCEAPRPLSEFCEGLPDGLDAIVMRALEKRREDRFADLETMQTAVAGVRRQLDPAVQPTLLVPSRREHTAPAPQGPRETRERRVLRIAAVVLVASATAATAVGGLWWLRAPHEPGTSRTTPDTPRHATPVTPAAPPSEPARGAPTPAPYDRGALSSVAPVVPRSNAAPAANAPVHSLRSAEEVPTAPRVSADPPGTSLPDGVSALPSGAAQPTAPAATTGPFPTTVASAPLTPAPPPPLAPPPAVPSRLDAERPGILVFMNRYRDAYRAMDVKAIRRVYPSLGREDGQRLEKQFRNCRTFEITFANPSPSMGADPEQATFSARTTYTCTPKTGQEPLSDATSDFFQLRKLAGSWIIEGAGSLDAGTAAR